LNPVVTVFGSSRPRWGEPEYTLAYDLGRALALAGYVLCNGGYGGTMEASARGAQDASGRTIGITCAAFGGRLPNRWIHDVEEQPTFVARLVRLIERGDAYVILKGGTGTLLELAAVWEFMTKKMLAERPVLALGDFWRPVQCAVSEELDEQSRAFVTTVPTVHACIRTLNEKLRRSHEP